MVAPPKDEWKNEIVELLLRIYEGFGMNVIVSAFIERQEDQERIRNAIHTELAGIGILKSCRL